MKVMQTGSTQDDLTMLFGVGAVGRLDDVELLSRFVASRGDAASREAFAALVRRHGPLVRGVCRRMLGDGPDADDAFQATFLVLTRKAGAVRVDDTLGRWLYGVSVRVARRAKARFRAERRRVRGLDGIDPVAHAAPASPAERGELRAVIDEEIARLPERYRAAILLCDVEGLTQEQAARRLRCPLGTIQSRLHRARGRLRERLTRRGVTPATGFGAALTTEAARASIPAALADSTIRAAMRVAAGKTVAGMIPAAGIALAEGVLKTMFLTKLKVGAAALLAIGAVSTGAGLFARGTLMIAGPTDGDEVAQAAVALAPSVTAQGDVARLQGTWQTTYGQVSKRTAKLVVAGHTITITDGAVGHPDRRTMVRGEIEVDEEAKPKAMTFVKLKGDLQHSGREEEIPDVRCIYELDGDTLRVCNGPPGSKRPEQFEESLRVLEYTKVTRGDLGKIQGKWEAKTGSGGREGIATLLIEGTAFTAHNIVPEVGPKEPKNKVWGEIQLDELSNPKELTFVKVKGLIEASNHYPRNSDQFPEFNFNDFPAIYEFDGDTLKLCIAEPGSERRPNQFEDGIGPTRTFFIFKRAADTPEVAQSPDPYALAPGVVLKWVDPRTPGRLAEYLRHFPERRGTVQEADLIGMIFVEQDGRLGRPQVISGSGDAYPPKGFPLAALIQLTTEITQQRIDCPAGLMYSEVPGDFVVRDGAPVEKVVAQLESILQQDHIKLLDSVGNPVGPLRLSLREVEKRVIVARGHYRFHPLDGRGDWVEVYADTLVDLQEGSAESGTLEEMFDRVGRLFDLPRLTIADVEDAPEGTIVWHLNTIDPFGTELVGNGDKEAILTRLTEQTGLTFAPETRKIRILEVMPSN